MYAKTGEIKNSTGVFHGWNQREQFILKLKLFDSSDVTVPSNIVYFK